MPRKEKVYLGIPDSIRDLMHVDDHVAAYLEVMESDSGERETFNVGLGVGITMREPAHKVAELTEYKDLILESYPPEYPRRPAFADPSYLVTNPSKIKTQIHWKPTIALEDGLRRTIEYWRKRLGN